MTVKDQMIYDQIMVRSFVAGFITGLVCGAMLTLSIIVTFFM